MHTKETKMPTIEEIQSKIRQSREKEQDKFIDKITDNIEFLNEKANRKDYEHTWNGKPHFKKIHAIVTDTAKWF